MRRSVLLRLGLAVCGTWILFLCNAAPAAAAMPRASSDSVCTARPAPHAARQAGKSSARLRRVKSTPPARRYVVRTHRVVYQHPGLWLERSRATLLPENDAAALQDRTAVVSGEDDLLRHVSLEPSGELWLRPSAVAVAGVAARRAPRGPPASPDRG